MHTRVFEPRQLTVLTTSKCTAACRHCCMNSSPERADTLSWPQLESSLTQAFAELAHLEVIIFAGGEPLLLGQDLLAAIRLCKRHGVVTRIVTNAYWATSREHARFKLRELKEAGLDEVNISTDDYHLPWIPLDAVRHAYEEAIALEFSAVVLANCFGPETTLTPERVKRELGAQPNLHLHLNDAGGVIEHKAHNGKTLVVLANTPVQRLGRGERELATSELGAAHPDLDALGEEVGGCPWAIKAAAISARGHFVSCCGFEVEDNPILDYGDLARTPLAELLDKADNDLASNMIAIIGPIRIMNMLQELCPDEVSFPGNYRTYCEVCSDLVSSKQNRDALYRHMGRFAELVLDARQYLKEKYQDHGVLDYPPLKIRPTTPSDPA
ncbi:MAG: radical SAM protein [Deltaproteobacteria bacterium]|nr:radical SAM protein [Deltaproteobacteria bacterium]